MTEGDVASSDFARSIENVVLYVMHITTRNHPLFCLLVPVRVGTDVEVSIEDADTERRDYEASAHGNIELESSVLVFCLCHSLR